MNHEHELKILTNKVNFAKVDHEVMRYLENLITKTSDDGWKESSVDYEERQW